MTYPWDHPLIKKGMTAQLAKRRARIAAGEKPLGWKVGLGAPATMQKVGIDAPLVGFLMQRALLLSGSTASLKGYVRPVAEPEICVRMASGLGAGASPDAAMAAVKEIFPAIELADLDPLPAPDNLDVLLEGDIFQRHVILCGNTRPGGSVAGLTSRVIRRGKEAARTTDPEALDRQAARHRRACGEYAGRLRREAFRRRRHYHRLDHAAADARTGRA